MRTDGLCGVFGLLLLFVLATHALPMVLGYILIMALYAGPIAKHKDQSLSTKQKIVVTLISMLSLSGQVYWIKGIVAYDKAIKAQYNTQQQKHTP